MTKRATPLAFFEKICGIPSPILLKANSELTTSNGAFATPNGAFAAKVPSPCRNHRMVTAARNGSRI
ncbi:hypothetical protein MPLSOD_120287 [Mesorhizobium sp. SOD10]|nr:hypothetical protein MPLSOD_120287 [Mesorhizobium sp. SOD10]